LTLIFQAKKNKDS